MENFKFECVPQSATPCHPLFLYFLQFTLKEKQYQLQITPDNFNSDIIEPENIKEIFAQAFQNGPKFEDCLDVAGTIEVFDETCTIYLHLKQKVTAKKTISEEHYFFPEIIYDTPKALSFQIDLEGKTYQEFIKSEAQSIHEAIVHEVPDACQMDFSKLEAYLEIRYNEFLLKPYVPLDKYLTLIGDSTTFYANLEQDFGLETQILGDLISSVNYETNNPIIIQLVKEQLQQIYGNHSKNQMMSLLLEYFYE